MKCLKLIFFFSCASLFAKIQIPSSLAESHIPSSRNPLMRISHFPILTGDTYRKSCDWVLDETVKEFEPSAVLNGQKIFVGGTFLDFFLTEILPHIDVQVVLVVANGASFINKRYLPLLEHPKILRLFARNVTISHPKAIIIPTGLSWFMEEQNYKIMEKELSQVARKTYFKKKKTFAYLNISKGTHLSRKNIWEKVSKKPFVTTKEKTSFPEYINDMKNSEFVISPRGFHPDCWRTWEAMMVGAIPVVERVGIEEVYEGLPIIIVDDLTQISRAMLISKRAKLRAKTFKLDRLHASYWLKRIKHGR